MKNNVRIISICAFIVISASLATAQDASPFIGRWALTIPGGGAGWLGIEQAEGYLDASILWGGGSVVPVSSVYVDGDKLNVTRTQTVERKDSDGNVIKKHTFTETITATVSGDEMKLVQARVRTDGKGVNRSEFTGKKIPPLPAKPDLSRIKYAEPIRLFNGRNLDSWKLTNPGQKSGWSVKDGILTNNPVQPEGGHISYGNLRTVDEFEDFNIKLEINLPKGGNSGIYLRGIYEVQVADTFGRGRDSHNMGGVYSRITPTQTAEKPHDQWQTMDITLCNRHVTVILNGKNIIDNQPLLGCTGGALWSDEFKPGPIYLQGDHTGVNYRNIILTPIKK